MTAPPDLARADHRPWPVPERSFGIRMNWVDLLFLHWPVEVAQLRPHIPSGLSIDTFDGSAWLGVVPFLMDQVRPRFAPTVPGVSTFPELNLRTYVTAQGKPGVWFFSLDVTKRLAVALARTAFHLPYFRARMEMECGREGIRYSSERIGAQPAAEFRGTYQPRGPVFRSTPGSLDSFLTERYCLYSANSRGRIYRGDVHHEPWPLQTAEFEVERNSLADGIGISLPDTEPLAFFARELRVAAWTLEPVD